MGLILFSFAFNPETQEASFAGNINTDVALAVLQKIVIAEAVRKAGNNCKKETGAKLKVE